MQNKTVLAAVLFSSVIGDTVGHAMNPILRREFLARWRDKRSYLLLLAIALVLAIASYRSYDGAITELNFYINGGVATPTIYSIATRASHAGHALFSTLAVGNVGMWFVLAPLLLATGVARERECGLLESLQLSPMRPFPQIRARAFSALSYLGVLQLVTLPIYFVAFSFGGVSELEIARIWAMVAVSAFCGVGLGLALSAQSARPSSALFGAVVLLVGWSLVSYVGSDGSLWSGLFGFSGAKSAFIGSVLFYGHPLALVWNLCHSTSSAFAMGFGAFRVVFSPEQVFPWALTGWSALGLLGLLKATRDVTRPLPPTGWAGRNTLIQKWKQGHEARLKAQQAPHAKDSVEGALLADLPFDRLIRFKNPLLNREVKSRFRLRRASAWVWSGRAIVFLFGAGVWVTVLFFVFLDPPRRASAVQLVFLSVWLLGTALIATFAASSFAREREAGTWEGVRLSLLTPDEVTRTKWASPLVAFALLSSPLWLLLFLLLPMGSWPGVPLVWMVLGALVVASSLCCTSALGSWISLRAKSTASATCWTLGVLFALLVAMPLVADNMRQTPVHMWRYQQSPSFWDTRSILNALQTKSEPAAPSYIYSYGYGGGMGNDDTLAVTAFLHIFFAGLGTIMLLRSVRYQLQKSLD